MFILRLAAACLLLAVPALAQQPPEGRISGRD